jgi:hypothetical protein
MVVTPLTITEELETAMDDEDAVITDEDKAAEDCCTELDCLDVLLVLLVEDVAEDVVTLLDDTVVAEEAPLDNATLDVTVAPEESALLDKATLEFADTLEPCTEELPASLEPATPVAELPPHDTKARAERARRE